MFSAQTALSGVLVGLSVDIRNKSRRHEGTRCIRQIVEQAWAHSLPTSGPEMLAVAESMYITGLGERSHEPPQLPNKLVSWLCKKHLRRHAVRPLWISIPIQRI